jgi:hypothetical protein
MKNKDRPVHCSIGYVGMPLLARGRASAVRDSRNLLNSYPASLKAQHPTDNNGAYRPASRLVPCRCA